MGMIDRIHDRRKARGWTDQDFADRKETRQKIWNGIKTVAMIVPVPGVAAATGVADAAVKAGKEIKATGGANIGKVLSAAPEVLSAAIEAAKTDTSKPAFNQEVADLLKDPLTKLALEMSHRLIEEIETRTKIDIPEPMEQAILDVVLDAMDDVTDFAKDQAMGFVKKIGAKLFDFVKGLMPKQTA